MVKFSISHQIWQVFASKGTACAIYDSFSFNNSLLFAGLQWYMKLKIWCIRFHSIMQYPKFGFWVMGFEVWIVVQCIWEFCKSNHLFSLVLWGFAEFYVFKFKWGENTKKQPKSGKTAFFAFVRSEGKVEDFRAILRRYESHINRFISANKGQNRASRRETK